MPNSVSATRPVPRSFHRLQWWLLPLFLFLAVSSEVGARTFLVDLNSSKGYRGLDPASPDANGNHWNAFPHAVTGSSQLNGLVATDGGRSSVDFGSITPFGSDSYNGPAGDTTVGAPSYALDPVKVSATDIDAAALGALGIKEAAFDYIGTVSHTNVPTGQSSPVNDARFAIQGLDPQITYTLRLFGSRKYADESTTIYEAFSDPAFEYLSAATSLEVQDALAPGNHNRGTVAVLSGIRPSASGAIYLRVRAEGGKQGYLNSMQIVEGTRPVDSRGLVYIRLENPTSGREIVGDPDLGPVTRLDPPATNLRGHWYLMTRTDNTLVWIINRVTGEALRAAADSGFVSTALWNPDDPRQTWRVTTANGVSRLRIEGTTATLTAGAEGAAPSVGADASSNPAQDWILPELPRGGLFPWTTYDEDNIVSLSAPAEIIRSAYSDGPVPLAAEAQKRGVILLNDFGTSATWTTSSPADAMTLRYNVADGATGTLTLNIRRAGQIVQSKKISVTSAQAWVYFDSQGNELQSAGTGRTPAKRFNEARVKLASQVAVGDTIELRRETGDSMVWIDTLEAEASALVPLPDAASYLAVSDFGATGNGIANDTVAVKNAVAAAAAQGKKLYLPPGIYRLEEEIILPPGFVLQGAGLWKTELIFSRAAASAYAGQALGGIKGTGSNTIVRDLYMKSAQDARSLGYHALKGSWGTGSLVENVWADQFETGAWIADFSNDGSVYTDGLVIRNCRLRNAFADGVNYASGTRNSVVENTHVRGCGDDGLASYASGRTLNKPTTRNIQFRYNTIECVYRAGGIGVFGGEGHKIHHNVIRDQVAGPGLRLNTIFVYLNGALEGYPFGSQLIQFFDNTLERTGALTVFNEQAGAIELQTWYTDVENVRFEDIDIDTTRYEGIRYSRVGQVPSAGFQNIVFTRIGFANVPFGTLVTSSASGESSFDTRTSAAGINNQAGSNFTVNGPPPPPPVIASFTPTAAARGSEVTVTGSYLSSVALVQVGAQTASFTVVNDNTLRFTVPPQAVTGRIRVTTSFDKFAQTSGELIVPENNETPVITLDVPSSVSVPAGAGLRLAASVSDDGLPDPPAALTYSWSVATAPAGASVIFDNASQPSTGVTFSAAGNYLLRLTVSDGELQSTADVSVTYGTSATGSGQDVGGAALPGSSTANAGTWTIQASGADIWDTSDGFHFRYAELRGDGFVQVRLLGQTYTDPWAKAGVMIRDSITAGSAHAMLVGTTGNGLALQNRSIANGLSQHQALGPYAYGVWLRLVRTGSTITAYRSENGTTWTQVGTSVSPTMADPVYVGLAVTSHNNGALSTATFDNLQGSGFGVAATSVSAGSDVSADFGNSATLSGSAAGASSTSWEKLSGPGTLNFGSPSSLSTAVTASAAGTYRVRLNASNGGAQTFDDAVLTFIDNNKQPATVALTGLSATYNGSAHPVGVATTPADLSVVVTYNGSPVPPTGAGTYAVLATVNDANYQGSASGTLVIAKAEAGVALANPAISTTYDGNAKTSAATTSPPGLTVSFTYNGSAVPPVNAGTYAVVATIDDANYQGSATGSLVIARATAGVTIGNLAQTYDGSARSVSVTTTPTGLAKDITYNGSAVLPVNAGTYSVAAQVSDPNYEGTASASLVVGKAAATVLLGNLEATFDGAPKQATITTVPPGLSTTVTYNGSPTAPFALGSYPVAASITDANYQGSATGSLVISLDAPAARGTALVDFGPTSTAGAPAGIYWNNFTNADAGYALTNLVTTNNSATGFGISMTTVNSLNTGWISTADWVSNNATALGLLNSQTAATDGFFVAQQQGRRGVKISGLDTNKTYNLGVFGTRNASETRSTTYTVRGASTNTGVLTNSGAGIGVGGANFNNNKVLSFSNVAPDTNGAIVLEYQRLQGAFGYLNALSITENGPVITATGSITALSTTFGTPSSPDSFTASGTGLLEGITVFAPPGYEVSTNSASGYAASITFGSAGTVTPRSIFVRLAATAPAGTHAGTVTVFSRGASTRIIPVATGTVLPAALGTVTFTPPASLSSDGSAKEFTAAADGVTLFSFVYAGRNGTTYGPSSSAPVLPGFYNVTATPDANFSGSAQENFFVTGPMAESDSLSIALPVASGGAAIPVASLLLNDRRIDGTGSVVSSGLSVISVGMTSGGTQPAIVGGNVLFTPSSASAGVETFTYTVADEAGSESSATVTVTLTAPALPPPQLQLYLVGNAVYQSATDTTRIVHRFSGPPNESLVFEYTEQPGSAFRGAAQGGYAASIQPNANGIFELIITESGNKAALWNSKMFFRVRRP